MRPAAMPTIFCLIEFRNMGWRQTLDGGRRMARFRGARKLYRFCDTHPV
jgi:hypothetical protein